jgi:selenophosphate synthetase-related protein
MAAAKIGEITETRKLEITNNAEKAVVWDFAKDTIMGIGAVACR